MSMTTVKRPGIVTFIGVILYIQAFLAVVAGIVAIAYKTRLSDTLEKQSGVSFSDSSVLGIGIVELIVAVLLFVVASGIMRGSRGWRAFVGIVEGLRMASALFAMLYYHDSAFVESGIVTLLIGTFVLWALYGHEKSEEFFESA
jgi:hypothetical protein